MRTTGIRTTIYIPASLHEKAKAAGINFSKVACQAIEMVLFRDSPEYLEHKLKEALDKKKQNEREIEELRISLEKAKSDREKRAQEMKEMYGPAPDF